MVGLEVIAFLTGCLVTAASALTAVVYLSERKKREFVKRVSAWLADVHHVESGNVDQPLAFTLGATRVRAVVRGEVELWQIELVDAALALTGSLAIVHRDWRAPDIRALPSVTSLSARLEVYADGDRGDADVAGLVSRARADLCHVLGRRTRRCVVAPGRVFLELTRDGLDLDDLKDGLQRLEGIVAVLSGEAPRLPLPPSTSSRESAVAGPHGTVVPVFT